MDDEARDQLLQNLESRMGRVEQFLPTLATRAEMHAAIAGAVAPLPTRAEMHAAIAEAVAPLPTRVEMHEAIREEGERSRRHTDRWGEALRGEMRVAIAEQGEQTRHQMEVLFESLRDDIRIIAEGHAGLTSRVVSLEGRVERDIGAIDLRVTAIEHRAEP